MNNDGRAIRRTLLLLRAIRQHEQWFGITEIADQTHLPKSVVHRHFAVFLEEGIIERDELYGPKYRKKQRKQVAEEVRRW